MTTRMVCAGDSNTRGEYGVGYVGMLRERWSGRGIDVVAEGVNGDTSENLARRLAQIVWLRPDAVTVLIGTNDLWGSLSQANGRLLMRRKGLAEPPTLDGYRDRLGAIVARLVAETDARIAVLSPPVLGQDPDGPAGRAGERFAEAAREVAGVRGVDYLPLFERQSRYLRESGAPPARSRTGSVSGTPPCWGTVCYAGPTMRSRPAGAWR
ncbi:GDSL-type esterase/lipase family protein [Nocardiopsis sp. CNR-923]|uniref:SGNH/GDSL hydrolase family protein n=1 Tax=Nocardiopsis sp. CNR-923 TaxID=1904965 RepID=UPI00130184B9|nr:GDSL-type esterase/lipase family protein [Nocardiopsis sp. CNR-923]